MTDIVSSLQFHVDSKAAVTAAEKLDKSLDTLIKSIDKSQKVVKKIGSHFASLSTGQKKTSGATAQYAQTMGKLAKATKSLATSGAKSAAALTLLSTATQGAVKLKSLVTVLPAAAKALKTFSEAAKSSGAGLVAFGKAFAQAYKVQEAFVQSARELQAELTSVASQANKAETQVTQLSEAYKEADRSSDQFAKGERDVAKEVANSTQKIEQVDQQTDEYRLSSDKLNKKLKETSTTAQETGGAFQKMSGIMAGMGAAVASFYAVSQTIGVIGSFIKQASDAQETTNKFDVVFGSVLGKATQCYKTLEDDYNMSRQAAKTMLADTGDILSGFGFSGEAALDLSMKIATLGTDLASYTNYAGGVSGATEALTKAMLGEREQAKMLGIVITEEMVKAQMLADAKNGEIQANEQLAKAVATYKIALSQSPNAIGDTARSVGTFQNTLNKLNKNLTNFKENVGNALVAPATKVIGAIAGILDHLNKMDPTMLSFIATTGAGIAIIGSLAMAIGGAVMAYKTYTAIQTTAKVATDADSAATDRNTASQKFNAAAAGQVTAAKKAQTAATWEHVKACEAERAASSRGVGADVASDVPSWARGKNYSGKKQKTYTYDEASANLENMFRKKNAAKATKFAERAEKMRDGSKYSRMGKAAKEAGNVRKLESIPGLGNVMKLFQKVFPTFSKFMRPLAKLAPYITKAVGYITKFVSIVGKVVKTGSVIIAAIATFCASFYGTVKLVENMPMWIETAIDVGGTFLKNSFMKLSTAVLDGAEAFAGKAYDYIVGIFTGETLEKAAASIKDLFLRPFAALFGFKTDTMMDYQLEKRRKAQAAMQKVIDDSIASEKALQESRKATAATNDAFKKQMSKNIGNMFRSKDEQERIKRNESITTAEKTANSMALGVVDKNAGKRTQMELEIAAMRRQMQAAKDKAEGAKNKAESTRSVQDPYNRTGDSKKFDEYMAMADDATASAKILEEKMAAKQEELKALAGPTTDIKKYGEAQEGVVQSWVERANEDYKKKQETAQKESEHDFDRGLDKSKSNSEREKLIRDQIAKEQSKYKDVSSISTSKESLTKQVDALVAQKVKMAETGKYKGKDATEADLAAIDKQIIELIDAIAKAETPEELKERKERIEDLQTKLGETAREAEEMAKSRRQQQRDDTVDTANEQFDDASKAFSKATKHAAEMAPSAYKKAADSMRSSIIANANVQINEINKQISELDSAIASETDEGRRKELEDERRDALKQRHNAERQRDERLNDHDEQTKDTATERRKKVLDLRTNIQKSMESLALKECKTEQQRMLVYQQAYQRAAYAVRTAKTDEERFRRMGELQEAAGRIQESFDAQQEKRRERLSKIWDTASPVKAVTAGSTEAFSIQHKMFNPVKKMEKTTDNIFNVNRQMFGVMQQMLFKSNEEISFDVAG